MSGMAVELFPADVRDREGYLSREVYLSRLLRPHNLPDAARGTELNCRPDDPVFALRPRLPLQSLGQTDDLPSTATATGGDRLEDAPVRAAGDRLFISLSAHPAVDHAITLALAPDAGIHPIYLKTVDVMDDLPWEALHHPRAKFFALDDRWPIARLPMTSPAGQSKRRLDPPLRILAVLAALGEPAKPEWDALYTAIHSAPVGVELHVLVCEDGLRQHIAGLGDPRIKVDYLRSKDQLVQAAQRLKVHLLHLFCHGSATLYDTSPYLQLATRRAWKLGQDKAVTLEANDLQPLASLVWLAMLNCCEGAKPSAKARSMAATMVWDGFPAVVAMREPVAVPDANRFCGAFYTAALAYLADRLSGGGEVELEWARVMSKPRRALCDELSTCHRLTGSEAAAVHPEWTLPVLYVGTETTMVRPVPARWSEEEPYLSAQLDELLRARSELHPDTPQAIFDAIDEKIGRVTAMLYPPSLRR
jgi:hypothetical protein